MKSSSLFALCVIASLLFSLYVVRAQPAEDEQGEKEECPNEEPSLVVTKKDKGENVALTVGKVMQIQLNENPTTGYIWQVKESNEANLELLCNKFKSVGRGLIGAGGIRLLTFKALKAGSVPLKLVNSRPWLSGQEPADSFEVTVTVA
eukprot:TRINITY_DN342_c0_g1_i1.p1 TRINITY_DN342_c0_g1~~TRINITY_DN342_c0_g1_i1.p1  ORF type:complete len:148 (+),score=44.06 TRINITY_DN342_c0_g1_i1:92-535(+)